MGSGVVKIIMTQEDVRGAVQLWLASKSIPGIAAEMTFQVVGQNGYRDAVPTIEFQVNPPPPPPDPEPRVEPARKA